MGGKVVVFPGQGSQVVGMGEGLFEDYKQYIEKADAILGYSVEQLCLKDPDRQLSNTKFTQPALFIVNALTFLRKLDNGSADVNYFAGHSLGEYNALFAAGAFSFEDGLRIVKKRGELMTQASGGGMAAVIGCKKEKIREILHENSLDAIDVANFNSPMQTVISGPLNKIFEAQKFFDNIDAHYVQLPVSAPFHSRYMSEIRDEFQVFLKNFQFKPLRTPVIANINALPYQDHQIIYNLKEQLCGSVQWVNSIDYLLSVGAVDFQEVGPGIVLTKLIHDIKAASKVIN